MGEKEGCPSYDVTIGHSTQLGLGLNQLMHETKPTVCHHHQTTAVHKPRQSSSCSTMMEEEAFWGSSFGTEHGGKGRRPGGIDDVNSDRTPDPEQSGWDGRFFGQWQVKGSAIVPNRLDVKLEFRYADAVRFQMSSHVQSGGLGAPDPRPHQQFDGFRSHIRPTHPAGQVRVQLMARSGHEAYPRHIPLRRGTLQTVPLPVPLPFPFRRLRLPLVILAVQRRPVTRRGARQRPSSHLILRQGKPTKRHRAIGVEKRRRPVQRRVNSPLDPDQRFPGNRGRRPEETQRST